MTSATSLQRAPRDSIPSSYARGLRFYLYIREGKKNWREIVFSIATKFTELTKKQWWIKGRYRVRWHLYIAMHYREIWVWIYSWETWRDYNYPFYTVYHKHPRDGMAPRLIEVIDARRRRQHWRRHWRRRWRWCWRLHWRLRRRWHIIW